MLPHRERRISSAVYTSVLRHSRNILLVNSFHDQNSISESMWYPHFFKTKSNSFVVTKNFKFNVTSKASCTYIQKYIIIIILLRLLLQILKTHEKNSIT